MQFQKPMARIALFVSIFAPALALPLRAQEKPAPPPAAAAPPPANPADVKSADAILAAVYDVISGPAGHPRDWNRFRSLFVPGARLIPVVDKKGSPLETRVITPDEYARLADPYFQKNGFYEREAARHQEKYANILEAFSTYESRHDAADPKPFARGINSFQLFFDGTRWWVVTIYWQEETPQDPLPQEYLPPAK
ncbi:MAG TPA: hypothetical protein VMJ93_00370 [Verrucomicrobiae bacterium]|nr:hypothetical protein [Verrucomicrobiae bacterium]